MNYIGNSRKTKRKKNNKVVQFAVVVVAVVVSIYLLAKMNLPVLSDISGVVVSRSRCCSKYSKWTNS